MMATDISGVPTSELDLEGAFRRSRNGAIILTVISASMLFQLAFVIGPGIEAFQAVFAGENISDVATEALGGLVILGFLSLFAIILTLFAWFMRSRIAMWLGGLLFVINWLSYIMIWASGEFEFSGLLLNVLGPFFLWKGIQGANRYHALKRARPQMDTSVFE